VIAFAEDLARLKRQFLELLEKAKELKLKNFDQHYSQPMHDMR
jgi:hypothetical protein